MSLVQLLPASLGSLVSLGSLISPTRWLADRCPLSRCLRIVLREYAYAPHALPPLPPSPPQPLFSLLPCVCPFYPFSPGVYPFLL